MIDLEQAAHVEKYIFGTVILILLSGIYYFIKRIERKDDDLKEISNKVIEALGENNEIIRNNTEMLNQIKSKL
jgi:hypothetical protein